jgi:hypothetical protein
MPMDVSAGKGVNVCVYEPLHVEILELAWESGIRVARNKTEIFAPHWQKGKSFDEENRPDWLRYPTGSTHPGVYLLRSLGKSWKLRVKVRIYNVNSLTGKFYLRGVLPSSFSWSALEMKSIAAIPLSEGEHEIDMEIVKLPSALQHYEGNSKWEIEKEGGRRRYPINDRPRLEVFVICDSPAGFYREGVWVEALRLTFKRAGADGLQNAANISARVTKYCHTKHGMRYETEEGEAGFGVNGHGGAFKLMNYIKKVSNVVNCYDQAAAVQSLCGCLGVKTGWMYQNPFGYIKTTDLVGVGKCNNPFYENASLIEEAMIFLGVQDKPKPVVAFDDPNRTAFGNHAFSYVEIGYIRDACAGPCVGTDLLRDYLEKAIDFDRILVDYGAAITDGNRNILLNERIGSNKITAGVTGLK